MIADTNILAAMADKRKPIQLSVQYYLRCLCATDLIKFCDQIIAFLHYGPGSALHQPF